MLTVTDAVIGADDRFIFSLTYLVEAGNNWSDEVGSKSIMIKAELTKKLILPSLIKRCGDELGECLSLHLTTLLEFVHVHLEFHQ